MSKQICIPGDIIGQEDEKRFAGNGAYSRNGDIVASLGGVIQYRKMPDSKISVNVTNKAKPENALVPSVGALVTVKVKSVNPRFCKCEINRVGCSALSEPFRGIIKKEDVKATERDRVEMSKSFRPGDVVQARVLCLGDSTTYLLSTAENELGVVIAVSEAGENMVPISWQEMQCPKTFMKEFRKVAKVQPQYLAASS